MQFKLTVLPGDGIGPEVIEESIKVLRAVGARFGHEFEFPHVDEAEAIPSPVRLISCLFNYWR